MRSRASAIHTLATPVGSCGDAGVRESFWGKDFPDQAGKPNIRRLLTVLVSHDSPLLSWFGIGRVC
jgi:hypothetical protein